MRKVLGILMLVVIGVFLAQCSKKMVSKDKVRIDFSTKQDLVFILDNKPQSTTIDTLILDDTGQIVGRGQVLTDKHGGPTSLKIGYWKHFDLPVRPTSEGEYKVDSFVDCCFSGPCKAYYSYKSGYWIYRYKDGGIAAEGDYLNMKYHIDTNCEGGDSTIVAIVTEDWTFFDEEGHEITIDSIDRFLYEEVDISIGLIPGYYPNHDTKTVEYIKRQ